ncbi:putative LRR containing protein, partial [Trachipleistophora hominis]
VSIDFQRNFYVPEETETLTLENIKMQEGQVLKINTNCKSLKIVSFVGVLDITDVKSLRSVVLHTKMPRIVDGQWIYLNNDMIDTSSMSDVTDYIFPYCLEVIVLRNVEFKYSSPLIISQKCIDLSIISCTGNYDLSRIKKLRKLTFYPSQHKKILLHFPI